MSKTDTTAKALQNLRAIKQGKDPRESTVKVPDSEEIPAHTDNHAVAMKKIERELDALYDECEVLGKHVPRDSLDVATTYWDSRRGQCFSDWRIRTDKREFGARVSRKKHFVRSWDSTVILINRVIVNVGDDEGNWRDTVRHEMAHALQRQMYGWDCDSHGPEFRECARMLGATPKACHSSRPEYLKTEFQ